MLVNLHLLIFKYIWIGDAGYPGPECAKGMQGPRGLPGPIGLPGNSKLNLLIVFCINW